MSTMTRGFLVFWRDAIPTRTPWVYIGYIQAEEPLSHIYVGTLHTTYHVGTYMDILR